MEDVIDVYTNFHSNGCKLAEDMPPSAFLGLYGMAKQKDGSVCVGCAFSNHGNSCSAKKKMDDTNRRKSKGISNPEKTNAEWAAELGVTKRQVARMRKEGKLI